MTIEINETHETIRMAGEIIQSSDNERMHEVGQLLIDAADRLEEIEILVSVFAFYGVHKRDSKYPISKINKVFKKTREALKGIK